MSYLAGNPITEKLAQAKRVTFEAVLTCALNTAPSVVITSPAHASAVTVQFASGATTATGSLTGNSYTGLTDMTGASSTPTFAVELLDGLAKEFLACEGIVTLGSASNATAGAGVYAPNANGTVVAGTGLAIKAQTAGSLNGATGSVKLLITVYYI